MRRGFIYRVAVIDWYSRRVLAFRVFNQFTTDFCLDAVREAIHRFGAPEIFYTDPGSQFTSTDFTGLLKAQGIRTAWTARASGGTTSSSSGCGGRLSTRRPISGPTTACRRPRPTWQPICISTTHAGRIRRLTARPPDGVYFAGLPAEKAAA
jgi:putative transposase